MGIDGMRVGGGRCPPLIVAGLIVACFLLVCNWWSLSTENNELLRQIDGLSQQLKLSAEQRDECVILRGQVEQRYKRAEEEVAMLHVQLGQERDSLSAKEEAVTMCNVELDSLRKLDITKTATVETLRLEKETISGQLKEKKEDYQKLQDEFEIVQDELNKLKLNLDTTVNKKTPVAESPVLPNTVKPSMPQLGPVPEGAVEVSPSGQQGIKHYGIPVLPRNPPGAVRQLPRFSVTMLKAAESFITNETQRGGDQERQKVLDADTEHLQSGENAEDALDMENTIQDSLRDRTSQTQVADLAEQPIDS